MPSMLATLPPNVGCVRWPAAPPSCSSTAPGAGARSPPGCAPAARPWSATITASAPPDWQIADPDAGTLSVAGAQEVFYNTCPAEVADLLGAAAP